MFLKKIIIACTSISIMLAENSYPDDLCNKLQELYEHCINNSEVHRGHKDLLHLKAHVTLWAHHASMLTNPPINPDESFDVRIQRERDTTAQLMTTIMSIEKLATKISHTDKNRNIAECIRTCAPTAVTAAQTTQQAITTELPGWVRRLAETTPFQDPTPFSTPESPQDRV